MSKPSWKVIKQKIKDCRQLPTSKQVISCLRQLFKSKEDGMVAFYLGREYEKIGDINKAIKYYSIAESLFILPSFKDAAKSSRKKLEKGLKVTKNLYKINPSEFNPSTTLFIVSCSSHKIWNIVPNAPKLVTARFAFRGKRFTDFIKWAEEEEIEKKGFFWMILSGEHGLIKPWDNISNYPGKNEDQGLVSFSNEALQNQLKEKRFWARPDRKMIDVRIIDFRNIICVNLSMQQLEKIRDNLPTSSVHPVYTED